MSGARTSTDDVFINCPFDRDYAPTFRALIFTVYACGWAFVRDLPALAAELEFDPEQIPYVDFERIVAQWLLSAPGQD